MKIGIIADSHDHVHLLRRGLQILLDRQVEAICHAGDFVAPFSAKLLTADQLPGNVQVLCVYGNNDGEQPGLKKILPQLQQGPLRAELGGRSVVMHHYLDWLGPDDIDGADVVITGHTHEAGFKTADGILYVNPGEACGILSGRATVALVDTEDLSVEIIEIPQSQT